MGIPNCNDPEIEIPKKIETISFNPQNKNRVINILIHPEKNSKIIGQIVNGNKIEIHEKHKSNWNKIKCGDINGFIKIEHYEIPQDPDENTMYITPIAVLQRRILDMF